MDVMFYGDSRNQPFSTSGQTEHMALVGRILARSPDLVMESGDLVYTGAYADYLSQFFPAVAPLVSSVPFMAVPGNHDNGDPLNIGVGGASTLKTGFARVFPTPQADPAQWTPYHAFVCGNAMFIGLNSESLVTNAGADSAQLAFLTNQLEAAAKDDSIDHVFVWFHHSPFSPASGLAAHGDNATVQSHWVPLFDDPSHKVTAVFTGHDHIYARMDDGSGVAYVVSGGAGASLSGVSGSSKAKVFAAKSVFNFVQLHIAGKMVTGTAFDDAGNQIDMFTAQSKNMAGPAPVDGGSSSGPAIDASSSDGAATGGGTGSTEGGGGAGATAGVGGGGPAAGGSSVGSSGGCDFGRAGAPSSSVLLLSLLAWFMRRRSGRTSL
jgi:hypothetical protein